MKVQLPVQPMQKGAAPDGTPNGTGNGAAGNMPNKFDALLEQPRLKGGDADRLGTQSRPNMVGQGAGKDADLALDQQAPGDELVSAIDGDVEENASLETGDDLVLSPTENELNATEAAPVLNIMQANPAPEKSEGASVKSLENSQEAGATTQKNGLDGLAPIVAVAHAEMASRGTMPMVAGLTNLPGLSSLRLGNNGIGDSRLSMPLEQRTSLSSTSPSPSPSLSIGDRLGIFAGDLSMPAMAIRETGQTGSGNRFELGMNAERSGLNAQLSSAMGAKGGADNAQISAEKLPFDINMLASLSPAAKQIQPALAAQFAGLDFVAEAEQVNLPRDVPNARVQNGSIVVTLSPANLGEVTIKLLTRGDTVQIVLNTSSDEATAQIMRDREAITDLAQTLARKAGNVVVHIGTETADGQMRGQNDDGGHNASEKEEGSGSEMFNSSPGHREQQTNDPSVQQADDPDSSDQIVI
ncbi:MAG: flagellar hook-length control protein FliK [Pseudomonadota bacterium]